MITLVSGVPGAGKSYYSVKLIRDYLKSEESFLILHNIEGLRVFDPRISSFEPEVDKFTFEYMDKHIPMLREKFGLSKEDNVIFFIDEASDFFPSDMRRNDVVDFFKKHRHYGVHIYLITQNFYDVNKRIQGIVGEEIRAINPRVNPFPGFTYKCLSNKEVYKTFRVKKEKEVFNMYRSFNGGKDHSKKDHTIRNLILLFFGVFCVALYFFFSTDLIEGHEKRGRSDSSGEKSVSVSKIDEIRKRGVSSRDVLSLGGDNKGGIKGKISYANSYEPVEYNFLPPVPQDYSKTKDAVKIKKGGLDVWMTVSSYVDKYPPTFYNYSFFHVPHKKFMVGSPGLREFVYPPDYSLPKTARSRRGPAPEPYAGGPARASAKSSVQAKSSPPASESRGLSEGLRDPYRPGAFDSHGLTLEDKLKRIRLQDQLRSSREVLGEG